MRGGVLHTIMLYKWWGHAPVHQRLPRAISNMKRLEPTRFELAKVVHVENCQAMGVPGHKGAEIRGMHVGDARV